VSHFGLRDKFWSLHSVSASTTPERCKFQASAYRPLPSPQSNRKDSRLATWICQTTVVVR